MTLNRLKSSGADATAWLRQGMAKQLALDLGINLDAQRVSGSDSISAEEVELRRVLYWSMYCDDKLAAAYTGRVCTLLVGLPHFVPVISVLTSCIGRSRLCCNAIRSGAGSRLSRTINRLTKSANVDVAATCPHPTLPHIGGYHGVFVSKGRRA